MNTTTASTDNPRAVETKTERLLLNFTVAERQLLSVRYEKSHADSQSDYVRRAVESYATLHRLVVSGADIVLDGGEERGLLDLAIPVTWNRESSRAELSAPRRPFELKVEPSLKELITTLIKAGAAPSMTQLVRAAFAVYGMIEDCQKQGDVLKARRGNDLVEIGSDASPFHPEQSQPGSASDDAEESPELKESDRLLEECQKIGLCMTEPLEGLQATGVLRCYGINDILENWEGAPPLPKHVTRWFITTFSPLLCRGTPGVPGIMKRNLLFMNEYIFAYSSPKSLAELVRSVREKLAKNISWSDFSEMAKRAALLKRIEEPRFAEVKRCLEKDPASPEASPVWLLVQGIDLKAEQPLSAIDLASTERALEVHPSWIRERSPSEGEHQYWVSEDATTDRTGFVLRMRKDEYGNRCPTGAIEMDEMDVDNQLELLSACPHISLQDALRAVTSAESSSHPLTVPNAKKA